MLQASHTSSKKVTFGSELNDDQPQDLEEWNQEKKPLNTQVKKRSTRFKNVKGGKSQTRALEIKNQKAILIYNKLIDDAIQKIIFSLIDQEEVSELYLDFVCQLLQPLHFENVLEERNASGWCGNPLCPNEIDQEELGKNPKYYIDMKSLKLVDVSDFSRRLFCCENCKKVAFNKMNACSTTIPYTRNCSKLLSMLFPEIGEDKLNLMINKAKQLALEDKTATIALNVKENSNPKKPSIGAHDPLNCESDSIEGFKPKINSQTQLEENNKTPNIKKIGYFFESCSESDGEEEFDMSEIKLDDFQELWTLFSRLVTKSTIRFFQDFDIGTSHEPVPQHGTSTSDSKKEKANELSGLSYEEMKIYQELYKEVGIDISEDVESVKPTATYEIYSEDGATIKEEVHLERFQVLSQSLIDIVPKICDSIGHTNYGKIRKQFNDLLSTFSYEYSLPSLDGKKLKIIGYIFLKLLAIKDKDFMENLVNLKDKQTPELFAPNQIPHKSSSKVKRPQKRLSLEEQLNLLEECKANLTEHMESYGIKESQQGLLTDVILFGVY
ncbi:hypothetical protein C9374_003728 [Naegleria lovaniensis]|uniref:RNA polymerase II subunit B1 CTD phosphatase RPAP2 homolog n=1 Tax=Naegleria lovaniensis TaxID=51637 RepID=A0AA88H5T1_NAELO|nr:uncharacterized protein C9374_003728 [Naegleria lovaniensis]KAG2393964.1 hypothetical protein C9374_003728 [Naegleria lovaniensis]